MDYFWIMFYQLFALSFWRHPLTPDDQLLSKWFNAQIDQNLFQWRNKLILYGLSMGTFIIFMFGWAIPLKSHQVLHRAKTYYTE